AVRPGRLQRAGGGSHGADDCRAARLRGQRQGAGRQLGHDAVPQPVRVMAMKRTLTLILALALGGCASFHELREDTEDASLYQPPALDYEQARPVAGGLYRGNGSALMYDKRAFRVGDILTVVLNEQTQSSKSAGTSFGKEASASIGVPNLFGRTFDRVGGSFEAERDFSGSSRSSQQNSLAGAIAVTVH